MEIISIESALFDSNGVWNPTVTAQFAASIASQLLDAMIIIWSEVSEEWWQEALRGDHSYSMKKYLGNFEELTILRLERDYRRNGELLPSGD